MPEPAAAGALIAIGTSAGGLSVLRMVAGALSPTMPAAICVVQHVGNHASRLASILDEAGPLPAAEARDGEPLLAGRIYVAPPSLHLVAGPGHLHLTHGPRENFARPAIDPLFRSAAEHFGPRAIGVILTGQLNDGTAGLYEIKRRGGTTIVQEPGDAEYPAMPRSAIKHVAVDHRVTAARLAELLDDLATGMTRSSPSADPRATEPEGMDRSLPAQRPFALTCPECGGALRRKQLGTLVKFDCHIGHSLTVEAVAAGQVAELDKNLEASLRRMNERIELCRQMAEQALRAGDARRAEMWREALSQTLERAKQLQPLVEHTWLQPQNDDERGGART